MKALNSRKLIRSASAALLVLSSQSVFAREDSGVDHLDRAPSTELASAQVPAAGGVNTTEQSSSILAPSLRDEILGVSPQFGMIGYADLGDTYRSRAVAGLALDFNAAPIISENLKDYYLGVTSGFVYSHIGQGSSNIFGANADPGDASASGSNLALIPVNAKVGYNLSDSLRVSAHGGGNLTYRSVAGSADFGSASSSGDNEVWRIFPNAGADVEWTVTKGVTLVARPDVTFTTGNEIYMGTVGLVAPLAF